MVRVNLIEPGRLSDQHLIAEYDEILMLVAYIKNYPELVGIPKQYCLGKGHMKFFKDKIGYLKKRHESLRAEMKKRGFVARKQILLKEFDKGNVGSGWVPVERDFRIIRERIVSKLSLKPDYYRYYGEKRGVRFFVGLIKG